MRGLRVRERPSWQRPRLAGPTRFSREEYNARGHKTKAIDPLLRETVYVYGDNNTPDANPTTGVGTDLLQVKQKNGGSYDLLASYSYNALHQPLTIIDALGKTTTYTYNAAGQVLTVTPPPAQGHSQAPPRPSPSTRRAVSRR